MDEVRSDASVIGDLEEFVSRLHRKGVMLWMEEDGLRYRAPKGVLTDQERQGLVQAYREIASFLESRSGFANGSSPGHGAAGARRSPLSFTQLAYWYSIVRRCGRPIRNIASQYRLRGPLRIHILQEAVRAVGRRHDALRTRIVLSDAVLPLQEVADRYLPELDVFRIGATSKAEMEAEVDLRVRGAILDAEDYTMSPLFKAVLLELDSSEHILVLALDHMISDLASLHILFEEVFSAYAQLLEGRTIELPPVRVQFPQHATRVTAQRPEMLTTIARRMSPIGRTRFPADLQDRTVDGKGDWRFARFVIEGELHRDLRAWACRYGTSIAVAMLTAYVAVVLRWCGVERTVITFMTDGRTSADLERTIGYLAFSIYIGVTLEKADTFLDLLKAVTEGYCTGRDEGDFGYALTSETPPEFTRNTAVNWLPLRGASCGTLVPGTEVELCSSPLQFSGEILQQLTDDDYEPDVGFFEEREAIVGQVGYPGTRFSDPSMARFVANITEFLIVMLRTPNRRVVDVQLK